MDSPDTRPDVLAGSTVTMESTLETIMEGFKV